MTDRSAPSGTVATLDNGLVVFLQEDHSAPLASMWTWYRVGSRNEPPGLTGSSHWVEHMQFKGTPALAKGQIFRDVSRYGGVLNAMTSHDWTAYYETLPADQIDLAIDIESDRMVNSLFDPAETESERTVILSERQGAENRPTYLLYEELVSAAFRAHPYGHSIIGFETDLRTMSRDDLYQHYQSHYHPGNAVLVLVGDFHVPEMLARLDRAFNPIPAGPPPPPVRAQEPPQLGERRVVLRRPAPTSYLQIAYHAPAATSPDVPALLLADAVLSGGKGLGFGGGGGLGRSARLYRRLVSSGLARGAGSNFDLYLDPYLMTVAVTALPDADPNQIEAAVDDEIEQLRTSPVDEGELRRAQKQMRSQYTYSSEGVTNQAYRLGQMEIVASHERAESLLADLELVTPDDIQQVANRYLGVENRTVGWLLPAEPGNGSLAAEPAAPLEMSGIERYRCWGIGGNIDRDRHPFEQAALPNGMTVLGQVRPHSPSVDVRIRLDTGAVRDPAEQSGLASFTARGMQRGTTSLSFAELNERTDSLGASLGVDAGRHHTEVGIRSLVEDLPVLLELAADVIRRPTFPEAEIETVRAQILSGIREADNDTGSRASRAFRQLLFPPPHPLGRRVSGELDTVAGISPADLARFHATHLDPAQAVVAVVGGVGSFTDVVALIERAFGDWSAASLPAPNITFPPPPPASQESRLAIPGKSQADIVLGLPTVARNHPSYYALDMANLILGRLGLMGRLGAQVRDKQGLAYYAGSQIEPSVEGSLWIGRAGVDPANIERAIDGVLTELRLIRDQPVSEEEIADAKSYLVGVLPLALESNAGVAATLLNIHRYGLGLDYIDRYPSIVRALTRDDLLATMRQALDPDRVAIAIAGPPSIADREDRKYSPTTP